jgi:hypothetical protein
MLSKFMKLAELITSSYSGGAKLMELIPEMLEIGFSKEDILNLDRLILRYPEAGLKILSYVWREMNREKLFIYTPF